VERHELIDSSFIWIFLFIQNINFN